MEEHQERKQVEVEEEPVATGPSRWVSILAVFALIAAGLAFGYGYQQRNQVSQLNASATSMNSTISDLQNQLGAVTSKLNEVSTAQAQAAQAQAAAAASKGGARTAGAKRSPAEDKRIKQLQAQLEDQKKQLKDTQDSVSQARSDLETSLGLTKDELNGSIARTHDEVVALQKRGERNFSEFDLSKSKQFQRSGNIMLSLRKADPKHKTFDLAMIVDDNQLSKKKVNLYEPIWIYTEGYPQPLQVVVNRIDKNHVHGYVSAPKYKSSDLSASATPPPDQQLPPDPQRPPQ